MACGAGNFCGQAGIAFSSEVKRPLAAHLFCVLRSRFVPDCQFAGMEDRDERRTEVAGPLRGSILAGAPRNLDAQCIESARVCGALSLPLKTFSNWREKFKAKPKPKAAKLLYRRSGLSHGLSHGLNQMTKYRDPTGPTPQDMLCGKKSRREHCPPAAFAFSFRCLHSSTTRKPIRTRSGTSSASTSMGSDPAE